jgi:hypothetical protein
MNHGAIAGQVKGWVSTIRTLKGTSVTFFHAAKYWMSVTRLVPLLACGATTPYAQCRTAGSAR